MTEFKQGDRVRVTFEGEVTHLGSTDGDYRVKVGDSTFEWAWVRPSRLEKIEPPVETFKPGDVVRSTRVPKYTYALAKGGYTDLFNGIWVPSSEIFKSDYYEKVSIE